MKKQFDLEYYIKRPWTKVVTREGNPVRIICTDAKCSSGPVVGIVNNKGQEYVSCFGINGHRSPFEEESVDDLFMKIADYDFKPFDKILVREDEDASWHATLFAFIDENDFFIDIILNEWKYAIPYEGNEDKCGKVTK